MGEALFAQLIAVTTGLLLVTGVLLVWRRSLRSQVALLAAQGATLALLALLLALEEGSAELFAVAALVLVLKGFALPAVLRRTLAAEGMAAREEVPLLNTTASLIATALLTTLAYLVSRPLAALGPGPTVSAVPIGVALVLYGFLLLASRRHAVSQLLGFLMLDNGIATVAFLTSGGVPLIVELGVSLDVLLVVLILQVLTRRMRSAFGETDLDDLRELRD
jgi:hydrogenase-4 component E